MKVAKGSKKTRIETRLSTTLRLASPQLQRGLRKQGLKLLRSLMGMEGYRVAKGSKKTRIETGTPQALHEATCQVAKGSKKTRIETVIGKGEEAFLNQLQKSLRKQGLKHQTF